MCGGRVIYGKIRRYIYTEKYSLKKYLSQHTILPPVAIDFYELFPNNLFLLQKAQVGGKEVEL